MAILKHFAVKNADYGAVIDYLKYQHDEFHLVPILDENGNSMLRDEFYFDGLNCNPEAFDLECELLNQQYHKNQRYDEIKCHHYIISHDPMDVADHGLTGEQAQAIGMEYAEANFPGHQALVCTHTDGSNNSGNIHTHIIINSLRKEDIAPQPYTERAIDRKAGYAFSSMIFSISFGISTSAAADGQMLECERTSRTSCTNSLKSSF